MSRFGGNVSEWPLAASLMERRRVSNCTRLHQSTEGQGRPMTSEAELLLFWDFSAVPLSRAAISAKIKDPNGAGPAGDERSRDGALAWISNAARASQVMTASQAPFKSSPEGLVCFDFACFAGF